MVQGVAGDKTWGVMRGRTRVAVLIAAAIALFFGTTWPDGSGAWAGMPVWLLQIVGFATLALALRDARSVRQAFFEGLWCATVWLALTFSWLFVALHTYGGLHVALACLAVVTLAAALGLYYAAACAAYGWVATHRAPWSSVAFAALWTMAELARGTWLTGFGWGATGYAHVDSPLAWYAPWIGVYGLGAIAAWLGACLSQWQTRRRTLLVGTIALFGLPWVAGSQLPHWTAPTGALTVELLQGAIPQDEKFELSKGVPLALAWYAQHLQAATADLVVAPEVAIPLLPRDLPADYMPVLQSRFATGQQAAMLGIALGSYADGYTNSVLGLVPGFTAPWRYDKHHLVPFGEFTPPSFKWFMALLNNPLGDFNRGDIGQASLPWRGQRLAAHVCYEDLFGEELAVRFLDSAKSPTIFVNVSNLGWFGDTYAIHQHLNIARMRALELQRPFIRATNTGATAIVDYQANVGPALPNLVRGVLQGTVEGRSGTTPYAWWAARAGLWPLWLLALGVVLAAWRSRPRA